MQNLGYLLAAFIIVWAPIFASLLWLIARERKLRQEIESLKRELERRKNKNWT